MEESVKNVQANATPEQGTTKIASQAQNNSSTGIRLGRSRFKPNLSVESTQRNRLRRISGSFGSSSEALGSPLSHLSTNRPHRIRTISNSSATSEKDIISSSNSLPIKNTEGQKNDIASERSTIVNSPNPATEVNRYSSVEENNIIDPAPTSPSKTSSTTTQTIQDKESASVMRKPRRLTESRDTPFPQLGPTVFDVRKADHKKKFAKDVPERKQITMFDLIYYNPSTGDRMTPTGSSGASTPSKSGSKRSSRANSNADAMSNSGSRRPSTQLREVARRLEEEVADDPDKIDEENQAPPVPQVKIGPDGELIIDEASTVIDTTAAKKAKEDLLKTPLIFESSNMATNYGSWGKKRKNVDWTERETVRFFKALSVFGTDFSMMENVFRRRNRHDLKMKFKKEERSNRALVDRCLSQGLKFDASFFDHESEQEEDEEKLAEIERENKIKQKEEEKKKKEAERKARKEATLAARKRRPRGQSRKKRSNRGYYSSDGVSEDDNSDNSIKSPVNPTEIQHPDDIDSVLHEALNSFTSITPTVPQKRNRSSNNSSTIEETSVAKSKRPKLDHKRNTSVTPESGSAPETSLREVNQDKPIHTTYSRESTSQPEEPSLLKKLLIQNKEDLSGSTRVQSASKSNDPSNPTPTFSFPPALLAANPGLANAAPGSIVVVASPRAIPNTSGQSAGTNSANQQLLHVFMVSDEENQSKQGSDPKTTSVTRGEKEKYTTNATRRLTSDSSSMSPLRQRKVSESCLDTTSVGRVRTHSGCNPNISPFHSPFSPPMNTYQIQPQLYHASQENNIPAVTSEKRSESKESEVNNKSNHSEVSKEAKQSSS